MLYQHCKYLLFTCWVVLLPFLLSAIGNHPLRRLSTCEIEIVTFKSDFRYYKELLIKERICSLWEQIHSFQRSSHLKGNAIEE